MKGCTVEGKKEKVPKKKSRCARNEESMIRPDTFEYNKRGVRPESSSIAHPFHTNPEAIIYNKV